MKKGLKTNDVNEQVLMFYIKGKLETVAIQNRFQLSFVLE